MNLDRNIARGNGGPRSGDTEPDAVNTSTRLKRAARECILDGGLEAATSRRITERAGANLASITYHFGSKDRLVAEALAEGILEWLSPVLTVLASEGDPGLRSARAVQELLGVFDARSDFAPVYLQAVARAQMDDELRESVADLWSRLRGPVADDIRRIQSAGQLGDWIDPDAMAVILLAVANGLVVQSVIDPDAFDPATVGAQVLGLLVSARVVP